MLTAEEIVTVDNDNKNDSNASHSNEELIQLMCDVVYDVMCDVV